jgi:hypothetical protein
MKNARKEKDQDNDEKLKQFVMRAYLMLLVGTTIFSNKAKNYVELTYLDYFKYLDRVSTYAWGTAALAFLYRELTHDTHPNCKYVAGYMTLLQVILNLFNIVYLVLFHLIFNYIYIDFNHCTC